MRKTVSCMLAIVFLCLGSTAAALECKLDPRLKAGNTFKLKFREFPTDARDIGAAMTVTLPTNYDPNKVFPVFLFMNGGKGSNGNLPALVEHRDFICVGMPIFVKDNAKPEGRYIVSERDAENLWMYHKPMLESLYALIPNINRKLGLAGGFSNGANSIRCLVEFTDGACQTYFNRYIFCEGGTGLYDASKLNGPILGVAGDRAMGIPNRPGNVGDTVVKPALACGIDAEYILMKDTRHEFNTAYYPQVRDWINRKVLRGGLTKNLEALKRAVIAEDWPGALSAYDNVALLTGPKQVERADADRLLQTVNAAGEQAWAALNAESPPPEAIIAFVDAWSPCTVATKAIAAGNAIGQAALKEILMPEKLYRWPELGTFVKTWQGFPVADQAQAVLAEEGLVAQTAADAMPDGDAKIKAWSMLSQHYPRTEAQAYAKERLAASVFAENKALFFDVKDKQARIKRIKELTVLLEGTCHERAFKRRYRGLTEPQKEWRPWKLEQEARRAKNRAQQESPDHPAGT